jgi:hypothetical protein
MGVTSAIGIVSVVLLWRKLRRTDQKLDEDDEDWNDDDSELPTHLQRAVYKDQRRKESVRFLAMKKPMYDNIEMYGPQGELLCTISQKKAGWYVRKQLAEWKNDDDHTAIQLLFAPKGKSGQTNVYTTSHKKNICVSCGEAKHHMRHYVVPYCYRTLLPEKYKSHTPHDIVIMCPDCHLTCEQATQIRQKGLEQAVRKDAETAMSVIPDRLLYHVKSCASALLRNRDKIPPAKREEYETLIKKHHALEDCDELTTTLLQATTEIETHMPNPKYIPGPQLVVEQLESDDAMIDAFIRDWRSHFIEVVQPRFLPTGWSIDNAVHCDDPEN